MISELEHGGGPEAERLDHSSTMATVAPTTQIEKRRLEEEDTPNNGATPLTARIGRRCYSAIRTVQVLDLSGQD